MVSSGIVLHIRRPPTWSVTIYSFSLWEKFRMRAFVGDYPHPRPLPRAGEGTHESAAGLTSHLDHQVAGLVHSHLVARIDENRRAHLFDDCRSLEAVARFERAAQIDRRIDRL